MVRATRVHSLSNNYTVQYEDIRVPPPPEMHVEVRHTAIVASSYDHLARKGKLEGYSSTWQSLQYPFTLGLSGVGVITEVGSGLLDYQIGQRVCYLTADEPGSFSEQRVILAKYLVPVPAFLTDEETASVLFEGMVAWMLLKKVFEVKSGDTILIQDITSGLGSLLGQWAKILGAIVIGTVASKDDIANAEKIGVDHVTLYSKYEESVLKLTNGEGVSAVFHSIGGDAIKGYSLSLSSPDALRCIAPGGKLVVVGGTGGSNVEEVGNKAPGLSVLFPTLQDFIGRREELREATTELFALLQTKDLTFILKNKYPLNKALQALNDLAQQKSLGSVILTPPIPAPKDFPKGS